MNLKINLNLLMNFFDELVKEFYLYDMNDEEFYYGDY